MLLTSMCFYLEWVEITGVQKSVLFNHHLWKTLPCVRAVMTQWQNQQTAIPKVSGYKPTARTNNVSDLCAY